MQTDKYKSVGYPKSLLSFSLPSIINFIHRSYEGFNIVERVHHAPELVRMYRMPTFVRYMRFTTHINWPKVQYL